VWVATVEWDVVLVKPSYAPKLGFIEQQVLPTVTLHDIPEAHIDMTLGSPYCLGARDEQRAVVQELAVDPQFLLGLAQRCGSRVFVLLNMATCRQPKPRVDMVDQKNVVAVDEREVRHQVALEESPASQDERAERLNRSRTKLRTSSRTPPGPPCGLRLLRHESRCESHLHLASEQRTTSQGVASWQ